MAFTKQQLEALKNSLLASGQPILASQHRAQVQGIIDELFDAQSRGNILVAVQSDSVSNVGDTALVFRSGQAYKIPISAIGGAGDLSDLGDVIIADVASGDVLRYNASNNKWENVALNLDQFVTLDTAQTITGLKTFATTIIAENDVKLVEAGTASATFIKNISGNALTSQGSNGFGFNKLNNIYFSGSNKGGFVFAFDNTGTRTYTLPDASGTLALTSDLTGYVTLDTNQTITGSKTFDSIVFAQSFVANSFVKIGGTSSQFLKANGSIDSTEYVTIDTAQTITGQKTFNSHVNLGPSSSLRFAQTNVFITPSPNENVIGAIQETFQFAVGRPNIDGLSQHKIFRLVPNLLTNNIKRDYQLPNASGTLALTSDLTGYVTIDTAQTITGQKIFSLDSRFNDVSIGKGSGNQINNTRVGRDTLNSNTTGNNNTAVGRQALQNNSVDSDNTAVGYLALLMNTGGNNTAVGSSALRQNNVGRANIALGTNALLNSTTGSSNIGIGFNAGRNSTVGDHSLTNNSIFIGRDTKPLFNDQTNQIVIGHTAVGLGSGTTVLGSINTSHGRWFGNLLLGDSTNTGEQLQVTGTARITDTLNGTSAVFSGVATTPITCINNGQRQVGLFRTSLDGGFMTFQSSGANTRGFIGNGAGISSLGETSFGLRSESDLILMSGGNNVRLTLASTGAATFSSSVQTGNLSGSPAQPFKIGSVSTTTDVYGGQILNVEINGLNYRLMIAEPVV